MPRVHARLCVLLALLTAGATGLSAQPGPPPRGAAPGRGGAEPFRHYPNGRDLPANRVAREADPAAEALRFEGDRQLPAGFSVRADIAPSIAHSGANRVYRFGLSHDGVPLAPGSDFVAIVGRGGRLLASRLRGIPAAVDATAPTAPAVLAVATAEAHARATPGVPSDLETGQPALEVWVDQARQGWLAWSMIVRATRAGTARFAVRYRVSALDATRILAVEDITRDATVHVQAEMWQLSPHLPTVVAPLSDASVDANGITHPATDVNGDLVVPLLAPGPVTAHLRGPFAVVHTTGGAPLQASAVSDGGDTTITFAAATEFALAQTTAFFWANAVNRWVRSYLPELNAATTALDELDLRVNANLTCNAFFAGDLVVFGRADTFCQNMATPTLVAHELGHAIHFALAGAHFDGAYSEGFGDTVAALVTDQPCVGAGMFNAGSCLRDLTRLRTWPVAGDPHTVGETFGQFAWALRLGIGNPAAAANLLGAAAAAPADIPDAVYLSFVVDDDDGLLGTCSPHQRALEAAADRQLLPRPQTCRPAGQNVPPTATDDLLQIGEDAGTVALDLVGNDTDPDGDLLEVSVVSGAQLGRVACTRAGCTYTPARDAHGIDVFSYTAIDTFGGESTAVVRVEIASIDDPLRIVGPADVQGLESTAVPVSATVVDPDGPPFGLRWIVTGPNGQAPCALADPLAASTTLTCAHDGVFTLTVVATQGAAQFTSAPATADILNAHPSVVVVTPAPGSAFSEAVTVRVAATFEDGPTAGAHTCDIDWNDGAVTTGVVTSGACTGDHVYAPGAAGARTIVVSVTDAGGARGSAAVAVQITGGALCGPGSTATCVALGAGVVGPGRSMAFEFSAWTLRGHTGGQWALVDGARFRFVAAVQTLEVTGTMAVMRGAGALNGRAGYTFVAAADDRPGQPDLVRVVVRDAGGAVVRDVGGEVTRGALTVAVAR